MRDHNKPYMIRAPLRSIHPQLPSIMKYLSITVCLIATLSATNAATLTNGSLTVQIRTDNGAIDTVSFGGTDYFNPGTPVSNWGFQSGTNTATFVINNTSGGTGQAVSVSPSGVVTGTYTAGGANMTFSRSYSLVAGTNTLRIDMTYQNLGPTITLRQFETFDPDQGDGLGQGYSTYNDVFNLGGSPVGQARLGVSPNTHTVILGSVGSPFSIASGNPFQIDSGVALNNFFSAPFDGNDFYDDSGLHIGFERVLATGQSISYTTYMAFGLSPASAQSSYLNAIPEPSAMLFSTIAGIGMVMRRRRN